MEGRVDKILLRIEEAADVLSLGRSKTYELIQAGEIPVVKIGRATRVPATALRAFVDRRSADPELEPTTAA
jgi:excisionase family DNA binding protein